MTKIQKKQSYQNEMNKFLCYFFQKNICTHNDMIIIDMHHSFPLQATYLPQSLEKWETVYVKKI